MTTCGAVGALMVGGRVVGQIKCELEAGHDVARPEWPPLDLYPGFPIRGRIPAEPATPHAMTLTWTPEREPDLDLFDPAETMDVEVPVEPYPRCPVCGFHACDC